MCVCVSFCVRVCVRVCVCDLSSARRASQARAQSPPSPLARSMAANAAAASAARASSSAPSALRHGVGHTRVALDTPTGSFDTIKFHLNGRNPFSVCRTHVNCRVNGRVTMLCTCRPRILLRPKRPAVNIQVPVIVSDTPVLCQTHPHGHASVLGTPTWCARHTHTVC